MKDQSTQIINQFIGLIKTNPFENSIEAIEELAETIISDLDLNVVKKLSHMFSPKGITLVYVLSESHLVIHTWPELGIIHVDMATCSFRTIEEFEKSLKYGLNDYKVHSFELKSIIFGKDIPSQKN